MAKKRILVVDDSQTALMLQSLMLRSESYEILTARDGKQAVEIATVQLPDLILLDVVMPVMDGFEACRRLRATPVTQATPVIMVTTRGEPQDVNTGFESGCTDFISKPVKATELLSKVRACLGV